MIRVRDMNTGLSILTTERRFIVATALLVDWPDASDQVATLKTIEHLLQDGRWTIELHRLAASVGLEISKEN